MSDAFQPEIDTDPASDPMGDPMWELVARDLAGEGTADESAAVAAWLADRPEDAAILALVKARSARVAQRADITVDTEAALHRVRDLIADETRATLSVSSGSPRARMDAGPVAAARREVGEVRSSGMRRWWTAGAAAAVLVAVVGVAQWRRGASEVAAPINYRTATGVTDTLRLRDGSTVVLAPGSELVVAEGYGRNSRTVTLRGAAFFEVEHDAARPFVVRVNAAEVRDLGTAFSIRTGVSGAVSVAVTHGIVALKPASSTQQAELRAGDHGVLAGGTVTVRRGIVSDDDVAWTRGVLNYRDTPLDEVQSDLQRWYGYTVRVMDPVLARRTLTASFRADSSSQALRVIALAIGADAVVRGDTVFLRTLDAAPDSASIRSP